MAEQIIVFNPWADRTDIGDSVTYARKLRAQAQTMTSG
jgi:hypothetical protein